MYDAAVQISPEDRRLIALLENPVAIIDRDSCVADANGPFRAQVGRAADACLGVRLLDMCRLPDQDMMQRYLHHDHASDGIAPRPLVVTLNLRDGPVGLSIAPLHDGDPETGFLCQIQDALPIDDVRLTYLMEHLDQGVWDYDVVTDRFAVSKAWRNMRGIAQTTDVNAADFDWLDAVHPEDRSTLIDVFGGQARGDAESINLQYRYKHINGHWVWILCRAKVVAVDAAGHPRRIVGTDTDVTLLRRRDSDLAQLTNKLKLAIDASGIGVWEFDPLTNAVHWDDSMLDMYGITDGQNVRRGDLWETYLHPDDLAGTRAYSEHCQQHGLNFRRDYRIVRPNGEIRHIRSLADYVTAASSHGKLVGVNIDVTADYERSAQLEAARQKLEHDAFHDALTGLANRRLLDQRVTELCAQMTQDCRFCVLHLDLDYFKQINDTLGHAAGDAVLAYVADQLRHLIEERGLVCRSGGDEFVVLFEDAPDRDAMELLCKAIISAFETPFYFDGHHCMFGVSIGVAFGKGPPAQPSDIFVNADHALYAAKEAGRGCFRFYAQSSTPVQSDASARQLLLDALNHGDIVCYYQPQFDADTAAVVGAEALVRWQCPTRGLLLPEAFMPMAEKMGLADKIDAYVFEQVLALQTRWHQQGRLIPKIAMNVSMARFDDPGLVAQVRAALAPHHAITFELLETAFWDAMTPTQTARLKALRALGVGIDLDDFGSGHSSVSAMQAICPDRIKVDQSLVAPIIARPGQLKTLELLSQMARLEGIQVVMEGLDTQAHLTAIAPIDCDLLQGFALARPMPQEELEAVLPQ